MIRSFSTPESNAREVPTEPWDKEIFFLYLPPLFFFHKPENSCWNNDLMECDMAGNYEQSQALKASNSI